jgi:predicted ATPase
MLIQNLSLKNFKCFEEIDVEFAPITLLTGANSSGKSSLIYSLLAVLQTEEFPFYLSPNGDYVNLGSFEEMKRWNAYSKNFNIDIVINKFLTDPPPVGGLDLLQGSMVVQTLWEEDILTATPRLSSLNYQYEPNVNSTYYSLEHEAEKLNIEIEKLNTQEESIFKIETSLPLFDRTASYFQKHNDYEQLSERSFRFTSTKSNLSRTLEIIVDYFHNEKKDLDEIVSERSFNYIGSFRQPPERTYYKKAKAKNKIGIDGDGYIDQIIEWEDTNSFKLHSLKYYMNQLELFKEIKSSRLRGGRFELTVKTQNNSNPAALTDIGFGVSQFLPIIVADLQLSNNSCLALSQPEIHLHPKIQALFGNFLANQIKRTNKQYIVETHSEYLLNRIRLLLVKGELKPDDVRVYYFENDGTKSVSHRVEFTTDGQIKGAPQGFFDTYGLDVLDIALNA